MKNILLLLTLMPCIAFGQTTAIPDANFEQALIDLGYDIGTPDGSVPTANIDTVTYLKVSNQYISDLTGIEDFTALSALFCIDNQLSFLDVSNNSALAFLDCQWNQLSSLDVSNNTSLEYLFVEVNQLTCLNVKNGNNTNFGSIDTRGNPNLYCIEVDDATWASANWFGIDTQSSFNEDCNSPCSSAGYVGIEEAVTQPKHLLYITDLLGRTTHPVPNQILLYKYSDGSVEKKIRLER